MASVEPNKPKSLAWTILHAPQLLRAGGPPHFKNVYNDSYIHHISHPNQYKLTWNELPFDGKRVAVYTCVTGGYDALNEPEIKPANVDYFAVCEGGLPKGGAWKHVKLSDVDGVDALDQVRQARYVKTHPHVLFPEYDYSIWVDGNFEILADLTQFLNCLGPTVPFASNWHPYRNCIYEEAKVCAVLGKENPDLMKRQVGYYRRQGMPKHFGLIETNLIARQHNDEKCIALMDAWWNEIRNWSRRDQLSLPYAIWKLGYTMDDLGFTCEDISKHPAVRVTPH